MELILIAAMAQNRVIGKNNKIPWHIPEEMKYFKEKTMGHALIMGRKTFESIETPLPGRLNVVLSRKKGLHSHGFLFADSLEKGIECCRDYEKIFILGGQDLFRESMKIADTILLSILDQEYEGDTFFPQIPMEQFQLLSERRMGDTQPFTLHTYRRKKSG